MSAPVVAAAVDKVQEITAKVKEVTVKDAKPKGEKKVKKAKAGGESADGPLEAS